MPLLACPAVLTLGIPRGRDLSDGGTPWVPLLACPAVLLPDLPSDVIRAAGGTQSLASASGACVVHSGGQRPRRSVALQACSPPGVPLLACPAVLLLACPAVQPNVCLEGFYQNKTVPTANNGLAQTTQFGPASQKLLPGTRPGRHLPAAAPAGHNFPCGPVCLACGVASPWRCLRRGFSLILARA